MTWKGEISEKTGISTRMLRHYENMEEAERILQEAKELNRRLDELCRHTGGCGEIAPCN